MLPLFDLHVHSTRSDGLRSLMELAHMTRRSGLAGLAITDHDILPHPDRLSQASQQFGIELIPGIELSTRWREYRFHLLGYGFDPMETTLVELCDRLLAVRRARLDAIVSSVRDQHPRFDRRELDRLRDQSSPGRKHVARELIRQGFATSSRVAFDRYLSPQVADIPSPEVPLEEAIEAIHSAGGVAVLAHPPTGMTVDHWRGLGEVGLDGLETRFGRVASSHRRFLDQRAEEYGWLATAGSDYHGDPGRNQLGLHTVSQETLDKLGARQARYVRHD
jgi:predicted metal-dependent phosphoesterase TrpH